MDKFQFIHYPHPQENNMSTVKLTRQTDSNRDNPLPPLAQVTVTEGDDWSGSSEYVYMTVNPGNSRASIPLELSAEDARQVATALNNAASKVDPIQVPADAFASSAEEVSLPREFTIPAFTVRLG